MSKKKPTVFKDIKLVGVHKEPTFGPEGLVIDLRLTAASKCIEEQLKIIKQLRTELDKANERIKKMSKGDLGPESILSGYSVLVKSLEKRRNELRVELHTAKAENERLKESKGTCTWRFREPFDGDEAWDAECGATWTFIEGGLKDNGAVFCMKCGRLIKEVRPDKESDHELS